MPDPVPKASPAPDTPTGAEPPVLYFDGYCGLCNRGVDWLLRRTAGERTGMLRFAPLQGATAAERLPADLTRSVDTLVLAEGGRLYLRSEAVLRIAQRVRGLRWLVPLAHLLPRALRDAAYDWLARNRTRWFGRRPTCRLPTEAERGRLLP